jgi:hypothetical protein
MKESARQTRVFAVRLGKTHGKVFLKNRHFICLKCGRGEIVLCRASWRKRTANKIFAVRPKKTRGKDFGARQTRVFP